MGYHKKLLIAGLAAGVSAYMLYRASKKRHEESAHQQQQQQQQAYQQQQQQAYQQQQSQQQQHTPADYHRWGATAPFLATAAVGALGGAGIASLFGNNSSHHSQIQQAPAPPAYAPSDLPFSALTDPTYLTSILAACVQDQCLHAYYNFSSLQQIAASLASSGALVQAAESWQLPPSLAVDLCKLALFDVCFLLDDSASMHSEGTRRRDALASILRRAADAAGRFDNDGMEARWMNTDAPPQFGQIRTAQDADRLTGMCRYEGRRTPLGEALENKILKPLVLDKILARTNTKPVLVIIITDGRPTGSGEANDKVKRVIKETRKKLERLGEQGYRADADSISYMLAAVGNDREAQEVSN
jgi:vWA found in TerF C terminus